MFPIGVIVTTVHDARGAPGARAAAPRPHRAAPGQWTPQPGASDHAAAAGRPCTGGPACASGPAVHRRASPVPVPGRAVTDWPRTRLGAGGTCAPCWPARRNRA